ncbi:MAG: Nif3-like dinuclear metal center hexameric protein [Armatimonadota bacterium]
MALTISDIQRELERLAPPALAESWDNVGLLVGDPRREVSTVLVALDATAGALEQAAARDAELLVVHHPLIFTGLKRLVEDGGIAGLVNRLIREGRGLLALHTNLDSAPGGLNHYVSALLDLRECRPLIPSAARPLLKLVVYVPETHMDAVRTAICRAGAGQIGNYAECTFGAPGIGTFRPEEGTTPYIGTPGGELERVREVRLETVAPRANLGPVLTAMFAAHPYEEVAYDLIPLENAVPGAGLGCIGELPSSTTAGDFLAKVREVLRAGRAVLIGDAGRPVKTVALCTGAGSDFLEYARGAGADLYLTGEVKHHAALLARQQGLAVIDAGHFATERPAVDLLADYLTAHFSELAVVKAEESDPFEHSIT